MIPLTNKKQSKEVQGCKEMTKKTEIYFCAFHISIEMKRNQLNYIRSKFIQKP